MIRYVDTNGLSAARSSVTVELESEDAYGRQAREEVHPSAHIERLRHGKIEIEQVAKGETTGKGTEGCQKTFLK